MEVGVVTCGTADKGTHCKAQAHNAHLLVAIVSIGVTSDLSGVLVPTRNSVQHTHRCILSSKCCWLPGD